MEQKNFEINGSYDTIFLTKNEKKLSIRKTLDNDIFFSSKDDNIVLELNINSVDINEWQCSLVFELLMKSIIGRYILNNNISLPDDFIDLDEKTITWHSDSEFDNILKLEYYCNTIKISLLKDKKAKKNIINTVRIRSNGSDYGYYYQEFLNFFDNILTLEHQINKVTVENINTDKQKKLSIFDKFKRKK